MTSFRLPVGAFLLFQRVSWHNSKKVDEQSGMLNRLGEIIAENGRHMRQRFVKKLEK